MYGKRVLLGGFAVMAFSFLWLACSSSTGTECALGAEGCACTSGGGCDKGLTCLSGRCVNPTTGTGGSAGSTTASSGMTSTSTTGTTSGGGSSAGGAGGGGKAGAGGSATGTGGTSGSGGTAGSSGGSGGSGGTGGSGGDLDAGRVDGSAGGGPAGGGGGAGGAGGSSGGAGGVTNAGGAAGSSAGAGPAGAGGGPSGAGGAAGGGPSGSGGAAGAGGGVPPAGAGGGAGSGAGGAGGSGGGPPGTTTLGGACKANGDCAAGMTCVRPTDNLGPATLEGVGNGLCTADCTTNAAVCGPLGGICVAIDFEADGGGLAKAACFESCAFGPMPPTPPVAKCHGRLDVACEPLNPNATIFGCIPICLSDADCGTRKCDPASGLCVDTPTSGKPLGSGCTIVRGQRNTECAGGLCLPIADPPPPPATNPGICTALCRYGTLEACGYRSTPLDAGPPVGACVLPWSDDANVGDLGLCLQLCDVTGDCNYQASNWTCRTERVLPGFGHSVCLTPPTD